MTNVTTVDLSFLDERVFNEWIVAQRWFASKTREVSSIAIMDTVPLRTDPPLLVLAWSRRASRPARTRPTRCRSGCGRPTRAGASG